MVEIIELGKKPSERKYTISCYICKTKFRFKKNEAKETWDQKDANYLSINCPVCDEKCTISVEKYDVD